MPEPPGGPARIESARERVTQAYGELARRYDPTTGLYYLRGYRFRAYRRRAVEALRLAPGDTVVEIGCGTGLNFALLERVLGPGGRIVGVDLTAPMLERARRRVGAHGWANVSLVQADALEFEFPPKVDAILSTYALSLVPECEEVIARGRAALAPGGRWAVLDIRLPENAPALADRVGMVALRQFAVSEEWRTHRPWEPVGAAMELELADFSWTDLYFGFSYLAAGSRR